MREYRFPDEDVAADPVEGTGLGILADPEVKVLRRGRELVAITPEIRAFLREPVPLIVTKANVKSRVHRRVHLDYVGVKLFYAGRDPGGRAAHRRPVHGQRLHGHRPAQFPYLHKVARVLAAPGSTRRAIRAARCATCWRAIRATSCSRSTSTRCSRFATDILSLYERPRVRVLARADRFDRFVSVLVFIPKDRYDTLGAPAASASCWPRLYKGRMSAAYPAYPEGPLARTHYIIGRDEGETPQLDRATLEAEVNAIVAPGATRCARRSPASWTGARRAARVPLCRRLHAPPIGRPSRRPGARRHRHHREARREARPHAVDSIAATGRRRTAST